MSLNYRTMINKLKCNMDNQLRYKCIKVPLKNIIKDPDNNNSPPYNNPYIITINDAVQRTHRIIIKSYQLIRLWALNQVNSNSWKEIDVERFESAIKTTFRVIRRDSRQRKTDETNELFIELSSLFELLFTDKDKEDGSYLTNILNNYSATEMVTAFNNNITEHFKSYLARFVNSYWRKQCPEKDRKQLGKELASVKLDLFNNTRNSPEEYHFWIEECIGKIIPKKSSSGHPYDLKACPQKYFPCMVEMNRFLEKQDNTKMYQCFPQRNDLVPKSITLDTTTLIELLVPPGKRGKRKKDAPYGPNLPTKLFYKQNLTEHQTDLWDKYFNINIRLTNYCFDHSIQTDGLSASIRFIHVDDLTRQIQSKDKKRKGRAKGKGITQEQKSARKKSKKTKVETKTKPSPKQNKKVKQNDTIYLDDEDLEVLRSKCYKNFVVVDPGKRDLFTAMDKKGKFLKYSFRQHLRETKRLKYKSLIQNHRKRLGITELEKSLNNLAFKTVNPGEYIKNVKRRTKINKQLLELYSDTKFRQYRWYGYLERRRADDKMINMVKKKFGKDVTILYGDWSRRSQMKYFAPTPNKRVKRKFKENFNLYNLDEYRTSKLYWRTNEEGGNLEVKDKKGRIRKKHAIKTFKVKKWVECINRDKLREKRAIKTFKMKERIDCINRDRNACLNMRKLVLNYLETGKWLKPYVNTKRYQSLSGSQTTGRQLPVRQVISCP